MKQGQVLKLRKKVKVLSSLEKHPHSKYGLCVTCKKFSLICNVQKRCERCRGSVSILYVCRTCWKYFYSNKPIPKEERICDNCLTNNPQIMV